MVLLEQVGPKFSRNVDFEQFKANPGGIELEPGKLVLDQIEREFTLSVLDVDTQRKLMTIEMGTRTTGETSSVQRRTFHIGYYDFPMIDNTRLSKDQRAAVVVNQLNPSGADLT